MDPAKAVAGKAEPARALHVRGNDRTERYQVCDRTLDGSGCHYDDTEGLVPTRTNRLLNDTSRIRVIHAQRYRCRPTDSTVATNGKDRTRCTRRHGPSILEMTMLSAIRKRRDVHCKD